MIKVDLSSIKRGGRYIWEDAVGKRLHYTIEDYDGDGYFYVVSYDKDNSVLNVLHNSQYIDIPTKHIPKLSNNILDIPKAPPKYKIGDYIDTNGRNLIVTGYTSKRDKNGNKVRFVICYCLDCGYDLIISRESDVYSKCSGCPCCSGRIAVAGINDIATTNKDIIKYLKDKNDGFLYTKGSHNKVELKCPLCGFEKIKTVKDLCADRSMGCVCSKSGKSTGERMMAEILRNLNVEFIAEYSPEWIFPRRYDFYIPSKNIIIELDGAFHKKVHTSSDTTLEQIFEIDELKNRKAVENGIDIFRVDIHKTREAELTIVNFCKTILSNYFDFNNFDFEYCIEVANQNYVKRVFDFVKLNKCSYEEAGRYFLVSTSSVNKYVKIGTELGW